MENKDKKYQTLMANLLNIDTFDSSLYFSIDNERFFDIYQSFGEKVFDTIYKKYDISLVLTEAGNKKMIEEIKAAETKNDVITIYKEFSKRMPDSTFHMLGDNLEEAKSKLVNDLELEYQKSIIKWKKIVNKAQGINIETNIWPLHIGFMFISVKTDKKTIFAPLFFKEVTFDIKNSLVNLNSKSDIRINSKLITFLSQEGFLLNVDNFDFSNISIESVTEFFQKNWNQMFDIPETIKGRIPSYTQDTIENTTIKFHPGMVLGFYNVSSGYLWNQMKKIIDNDEFEDILNPSFNKNAYREKIDHVIFDKKFRLFKIQNTNFSQDVATISSLYQDTIIWGPPGTGKSQTISNLITNIIARGFTALVVSQKKAALDVLKKRLKKVSIFCLFALNDKNLRQETFYKPLKEFIYLVENFKLTEKENNFQVFSEEDKFYVDNLSDILKIENIDYILEFYGAVAKGKIDEETFETLKQLNPKIRYELNKPFSDVKNLKKHLYQVNFGKKPHIFTIYPKAIKQMAEVIINCPNLFTLDVDQAIKFVNKVSLQNVMQVDAYYRKTLEEKTIDLNNDKILTKMILQSTVEKMNDFTEEQSRLYTSFAMAIRTGHLKPYKFFHKHKEMIKLLFPVIVTTPDLDLSMWSKEEFDYAILDESSQIFLERGIPILYLAKRKILAGDSQQMQPTRWFSVSYNFDDENDFGSIESLLDYASARGVYSILLDKNYRSKQASLMTFSSRHFYESKLDVIDDFETGVTNKKAIEVIQVDGKWENSTNIEEGDKVLEILRENLPKYKKIIALVFNAKQQDYLINKIFNEFPDLEEALQIEQISLKNIENIQGDEADLVIMSVVYDKNTSLHGTYVARSGGKNALNVAISRAKEKIIVVKSIYAEDVEVSENSTSDMILFKDWLKFLDLPLEKQKNYLHTPQKISDTQYIDMPINTDFKDMVISEIQSYVDDTNKFEFEIDYSIGTKSIDLVLVNKETKQIIKGYVIDNFDYNGNYKEYVKFKDSIKFLQAKQYPIEIINKINYWINKKAIIQEIQELTKKVEIPAEEKEAEIQEPVVSENQIPEKSIQETTIQEI
ncbi:superfamily I DNA and/or RNA helicase [Metamycoplasma subdolum]|uniref:Superfamily I DNA and/or RNA helicase n=2 Tax=Metamycoplasma subdolum TaxID=92407 RepID=A0A3L9ZYA1_9BACT|nr:superfamily I DNA and/or RNA helicase [Metamycoplasma subdolum]